MRRIAGTRKVGHAGTLDPMATGVLVVGVERATRLLHHLVLTDKAYTATIRLGRATTTDDAEGEPLDGPRRPDDLGVAVIVAAMARLTGADGAGAQLGVGDQGGRETGLCAGAGR